MSAISSTNSQQSVQQGSSSNNQKTESLFYRKVYSTVIPKNMRKTVENINNFRVPAPLITVAEFEKCVMDCIRALPPHPLRVPFCLGTCAPVLDE